MTTQGVEPTPADGTLLASVDELIDHMSGVTLSDGQRRAATKVLAGLQRNLERRLNRFFGVQALAEHLQVSALGRVVPGRRPVVSVTSLVSNGGWTDWTLDVHGAYWDGAEEAAGSYVDVAYTAGEPLTTFSTTDLDDVKLGLLEKASQVMTNRHDDAKSVKGFETRDTSIQAAQMRWTNEEVQDFERLRRRVVQR